MRRALVVINPIAGPGRTRTIGACVDLAKSVLAAHDYDADVRVTTGAAGRVQVFERGGRVERRSRDRVGRRWHRQRCGIRRGGHRHSVRDHSWRIRATASRAICCSRSTRRPRSPSRPPARRAQIDAGDLHGSLFFNVAGVGFDARIADRLAEPGARTRAYSATCFATVSELRGYEPGRYSIHDASRRRRQGARRRHHRSAGAVHRARQLAAVRQRRANRADARCSTTA